MSILETVDDDAAFFRKAVERHRHVSEPAEYEAVWSLLEPVARRTPTAALRIGLAAIDAADASERAVAVDILGLVAGLQQRHRTTIVRRLIRRCKSEEDEDVRWSLAMAAAHSADARMLTVLRNLVGSDDADVRYQVAAAAAVVADEDTRDNAVRLLLGLTDDVDDGVREAASESIQALSRLG